MLDTQQDRVSAQLTDPALLGFLQQEFKTCSKCKVTKGLDDFYKLKTSKDGRRPYCKQCWCAYTNDRDKANPQYRKNKLTYLQALVNQVIEAYGGKCKCCGETIRAFLTLDHVNGGGHKLRKEKGSLFQWRDARDRNYPPDYQVLCFNCNWAKHRLGQCPHQAQKEVAAA